MTSNITRIIEDEVPTLSEPFFLIETTCIVSRLIDHKPLSPLLCVSDHHKLARKRATSSNPPNLSAILEPTHAQTKTTRSGFHWSL